MCTYTPLFPTGTPGDPIYGVHWCEAGKLRRKACPMPSYDIPTATRPVEYSVLDRDLYNSLGPDPLMTTDYAYDFDSRPRLERRYTDYGNTVDIAPPRTSRKHHHSGGSSDRHRKRVLTLPGGIQIVDRKSGSRRHKDRVVIVDNSGRDRREKEKERERERERERKIERELEKEREREKRLEEELEYQPYTSSSRRNSFSRDAFLGRSSTGLGDDFFTSTSRGHDDIPRSSRSRKYEDILPPTSTDPFEDSVASGGSHDKYRVVEAAPRDKGYYTDDEGRRSRHHSHRHSRREEEDRKYKSSSSRRHDHDGYVEIEKANTSSRHRPGKRYIEDHLREPIRSKDISRAEEELARQRKRSSYGGAKFEDEGFFEPYEPRESSSKRYSTGSYAKADADKYAVGGSSSKTYAGEDRYASADKRKYDDDKYAADKKRYDEEKHAAEQQAARDRRYAEDKYAEEKRRQQEEEKQAARDKRYAEDKYFAEKAAAKSKYAEDRYTSERAEKEAKADRYAAEDRYRSSSNDKPSSSSKYAGAAAATAAAVGAAALAPKVVDMTAKFDELEKSGKYSKELKDYEFEKYERAQEKAAERAMAYDKYAGKDPKYESSSKYDDYEKKNDKYEKYDKYDKYGSSYDKYDDKYAKEKDDFVIKPRRNSSSYHAPTIEEIDDDDKVNRYNKRSSKVAEGDIEPLFSSPSSSPPPKSATLASYAAKTERARDIDREAHEDLKSSSLKLSDAEVESMLERRLEVARMRAEILRMKELKAVEEASERSLSRERDYSRDRDYSRERDHDREREIPGVRAIEAPRESSSGLKRTPSLKKSVTWGDDI